MSAIDERRLAEELGGASAAVRRIDWARSTGAPQPPAPGPRRGVLSSGRAWCDWETLFAAAAGREWPLTIVCAESDRARVAALNRDGRARVLTELPRDQHDRLLSGAAVYAIALRDDAPSAGHVRLMAATDAGTAVVATRVATLEGYLEDGVTARTVAPGRPSALREAIEALLGSPDERRRLTDGARAAARQWTYREYFAAVGALIDDALGPSSTSGSSC
jgi:glycosyltransferase involved in cell wall biosynthesis